jgi:hypothetical protein
MINSLFVLTFRIEIIQELSYPAPPSSPRPYCSVSPLPPGTPVGPSSRYIFNQNLIFNDAWQNINFEMIFSRFECPSACSIQPSPSPHLNQQSSHTSKFVTPGYFMGSNFFNSSIPPSPSLSVGCRSPIIPRKSNYTTLEVSESCQFIKPFYSRMNLSSPLWVAKVYLDDD